MLRCCGCCCSGVLLLLLQLWCCCCVGCCAPEGCGASAAATWNLQAACPARIQLHHRQHTADQTACHAWIASPGRGGPPTQRTVQWSRFLADRCGKAFQSRVQHPKRLRLNSCSSFASTKTQLCTTCGARLSRTALITTHTCCCIQRACCLMAAFKCTTVSVVKLMIPHKAAERQPSAVLDTKAEHDSSDAAPKAQENA